MESALFLFNNYAFLTRKGLQSFKITALFDISLWNNYITFIRA